jgi:hypothetical protein
MTGEQKHEQCRFYSEVIRRLELGLGWIMVSCTPISQSSEYLIVLAAEVAHRSRARAAATPPVN